jgi:hypothetical protein
MEEELMIKGIQNKCLVEQALKAKHSEEKTQMIDKLIDKN